MFRSIRWRIAIPYIVLTILIILALGLTLSYFNQQSHLANLENSLSSQALLISDTLSTGIETDQLETVDLDSLAKHWSKLLDVRVTLIDSEGVVVGESDGDRNQMDNHFNRPEVQSALNEGQGVRIRRSPTLGYELIYLAVPIEADGQMQGVVRVSLPLEEINTYITQIRSTIFSAAIIATVLAVIISIVIANRITQPLLELTETTSTMTEDDTTHLPSSPSDDEVTQLSHTFHTLNSQLRTQIQALETEQGKLSTVLDQMTDGVIIVDQLGQVELINPAAAKLFETEIDEALHHSLAEVVRQHQLVELFQQCQETGTEQAIMMEIIHQHRFIQSIAISLGDALPDKYLLLFQDLTRMRRLETVRRDFITNISHELRTPLASIKALTETLQEGAIDDPPAAERFLERMNTEVDELTHIVSELIELTRIESGQVPLKIKSASACKILKKASKRLSEQGARASVKMITQCPANLPEIYADKSRLGQVLSNLLHNAIKFTPEGGQVILAATQYEDVIEFSVKDTGIGIPAGDLPRIFERFYKADHARTEGGTGLGLAIARHLVEAHGGHIWVESAEGQGSTFYFTIPIVI